jgi:hypothetical protein
MRRQVSGRQERWQIDYHVPSVVMQRSLRHRSKRIDMPRRSSTVFLKPQQNRFQIRSFRPIISLCLTPSHCLTLFRGPLGISRPPHKQRGKKHGKGTVKTGNGFASVAYEGYRNMAADSPIVNTLAHQACNAFPACRSSGHAAPAGAFLRLGIKASCTFHKGLS